MTIGHEGPLKRRSGTLDHCPLSGPHRYNPAQGASHRSVEPHEHLFRVLATQHSRGWVASRRRFGPAVTGVLQSTLGNLPELFIVVFALRAGETVVAQTSIIGSLFANALLVLGLVIVVARGRPRTG
jgi:hypothetical protein